MQRVSPSDPKKTAQFLFDSLSYDNEASFSELKEIHLSTEDNSGPIIANGLQRVRKFNCSEEDEVYILLAIHRLESRDVDLVLTQNIPFPKDPSKALDPNEVKKIKQEFDEMAKSLVVVDHNLFA